MNPSPDPDSPKPAGPERHEVMAQVSPYLGLGLQLAGSMVFFAGAGYLLDQWLGTLPWLLIAGALLGMVAVFIKIYRLAVDLNQQEKRARTDKKRYKS